MATMSATSKQKCVPVVSAVLAGGVLVELVYARAEQRTEFAVWEDGAHRLAETIIDGDCTLVPYAADNNLIRNNVVLFPSEPVAYGSQSELVKDVCAYIHRYVDVSKDFEQIAAHYVLFSWVFDSFNELPYLRLQGNYGTGKTRFLQTVGSLCYRPIFASGASTVSPIFHMLDSFGGTLIIDEADFRYSDETADMVKILNNGNVRGMPVLRSHITRQREFDPRVFNVFGPKIVATRGHYEDAALESRFITEKTGARTLRADVPINLPLSYQDEALGLRNKLLMYRFRNWGRYVADDGLVDRSIEARLNQVFVPLLSIIEGRKARNTLRQAARQHHHRNLSGHGKRDADDYTWEPCV